MVHRYSALVLLIPGNVAPTCGTSFSGSSNQHNVSKIVQGNDDVVFLDQKKIPVVCRLNVFGTCVMKIFTSSTVRTENVI